MEKKKKNGVERGGIPRWIYRKHILNNGVFGGEKIF